MYTLRYNGKSKKKKKNSQRKSWTDSPVFIFDIDGLSRLNVSSIMVTRTFCHRHTNAFFIQIETFSAGAAVHRHKVRGAALLLRGQRTASQLAPLMIVGEDLWHRAALCILSYHLDRDKTSSFISYKWKRPNSRSYYSSGPQQIKLNPYRTRSLSSLSGSRPSLHRLEHRRRRRHTGRPRSSHSYSWNKDSAAQNNQHFQKMSKWIQWKTETFYCTL